MLYTVPKWNGVSATFSCNRIKGIIVPLRHSIGDWNKAVGMVSKIIKIRGSKIPLLTSMWMPISLTVR